MRNGQKLLIGALALAAPILAWAGSVEVTASRLNMRKGPSTRYQRLGSARRGTVLEKLGAQGSWIKVRFNGREAWAHGGYVKELASTRPSPRSNPSPRSTSVKRYTTANSLNVRSGPSTRYRKLGTLRRGTEVAVTREQGSWRRITYKNNPAWVHGKYLSATRPSANPPSSSTSSRGFIQIPNSGPGFFGYYSANRRWGTPNFVYGIMRVSRRFRANNPNAPRLGIGDLSYRNGGPISGHASHQKGVDGDFRPLRKDGVEDRITIHQSAYSRTLSQKVFDLFVDELKVKYIFFNDPNTRHTTHWPNHANHFHVRVRP